MSLSGARSAQYRDPCTLEEMLAIGVGMTKRAAQAVYDESGIGPDDVDVIELHDCFSTNEPISYEGLQLCKPGEGGA